MALTGEHLIEYGEHRQKERQRQREKERRQKNGLTKQKKVAGRAGEG